MLSELIAILGAVTILCGVTGHIIDWAIPGSPANLIVHHTLGGVAFGFLCLNAAVVVFTNQYIDYATHLYFALL